MNYNNNFYKEAADKNFAKKLSQNLAQNARLTGTVSGAIGGAALGAAQGAKINPETGQKEESIKHALVGATAGGLVGYGLGASYGNKRDKAFANSRLAKEGPVAYKMNTGNINSAVTDAQKNFAKNMNFY